MAEGCSDFYAPPTLKKAQRNDHCCVPLCNGDGRTDNSLSFHQFPSEKQKPSLRKMWLHAIRRDEGPNFKITKNTVVCSRHFPNSAFRWTPNRKCLNTDAVPSVFTWLQPKTPRKPPITRVLPQTHTRLDVLEEKENNAPVPQPAATQSTVNDTNIHEGCHKLIEDLKIAVTTQDKTLQEKDARIKELETKLSLEVFGLTRFSYDDAMIEFYTSFPSYALFINFFECIKSAAVSMWSVYHQTQAAGDVPVKGRQRSMELIDELLMFMCRLKCGHQTDDLAVRFNISKASVSRKVITWANFLYFFLGSVNIWPSRDTIKKHQPRDFATLYPRTRVIIDCTELFSEKPSSLVLSSKTFSNYKSHNTWKALVGIAPHGAVTFISALYSGCMSDLEITKLSGLLDLMEPGDEIMADKGFVLNKVLEGTGVSITTPHFLCSDGQFTTCQIDDNQRIASLRIHVERHIRRVKEYRLLQSTVPLSMAGTLNQMWTVANLLTLFRKPLIKPKNH